MTFNLRIFFIILYFNIFSIMYIPGIFIGNSDRVKLIYGKQTEIFNSVGKLKINDSVN